MWYRHSSDQCASTHTAFQCLSVSDTAPLQALLLKDFNAELEYTKLTLADRTVYGRIQELVCALRAGGRSSLTAGPAEQQQELASLLRTASRPVQDNLLRVLIRLGVAPVEPPSEPGQLQRPADVDKLVLSSVASAAVQMLLVNLMPGVPGLKHTLVDWVSHHAACLCPLPACLRTPSISGLHVGPCQMMLLISASDRVSCTPCSMHHADAVSITLLQLAWLPPGPLQRLIMPHHFSCTHYQTCCCCTAGAAEGRPAEALQAAPP